MKWLSNLDSSFNFGDRHELLAGIVALFFGLHNFLIPGTPISTRSRESFCRPGSTNQIWSSFSSREEWRGFHIAR
jgi:hypothetical protein